MSAAPGVHTASATSSGINSPYTTPTAIATTGGSGTAFVIFAILNSGSAPPGLAVSDNKGNTANYVLQGSIQTGFGSSTSFATYVCTGGTGGSGHTASVSWTGGGQALAALFFFEVTGLVASSIVDVSSSPLWNDDTATPFTTNVTSATTQASEIALLLTVTGSSSGTETLNFSANAYTQLDALGNANTITGAVAYKVLAATGTQQGSFTSSGAGTTECISMLVTLKAAAVAAALAGAATAATTAAGALSTAIQAAAAASSATSATGALTTAIKLAVAAAASIAATGSLGGGITLAGSASAAASASGALTTGIVLAAAATSASSASSTATNWATVVLTFPLTTGLGSIVDTHLWPLATRLPQVGDTIYYDPAHITINVDSTVTSNSNNCAAVVQFNDGTSMQSGIVVFTPFMVGELDLTTTSAGALTTAILLAGAMIVASSATGTLISGGATLAGASIASAAVAGALSTGIPLGGAATGAASAAGALTTGIPVAGSAAAAASATGSLSGGALLAGAANVSTAVTDALTTGIPIAGALIAALSATGALGTGPGGLSGSPSVTSTVLGTLTTGISAAGAAVANSSAAGALKEMLNTNSNFFVSIQLASSDGKYWGRYPQGNRPPGPPPSLKAPAQQSVTSLSGNAKAG